MSGLKIFFSVLQRVLLTGHSDGVHKTNGASYHLGPFGWHVMCGGASMHGLITASLHGMGGLAQYIVRRAAPERTRSRWERVAVLESLRWADERLHLNEHSGAGKQALTPSTPALGSPLSSP